MSKRLDGKVALITGTGGGQGRAAAVLFAQQGARVVGCDLQVEGARETVNIIRAFGGEISSMEPLDLSEEDQVKKWINFAVERYGDFEILYNNASGVRTGSIENLSREDWDFDLANEVTLIFLAVKHALPVFKRLGHGVIINTASVAGTVGAGLPGNLPGNLVHNVAKAAVIRLSQNLAIELSPYDIRVNSISPGIIDTPVLRPILGNEPDTPARREFIKPALIPRIGRPEDIAYAALYLASQESSYVTGINLVVDGGWSASGGIGRPKPETQEALGEMVAQIFRSGE